MTKENTSPACEELAALIDRSLRFLSDDYGFEPVYQEGGSARCVFVMESKDCRLRFVYEFGAVGMDIGSLDAAPGWSDAPRGIRQWFGMDAVLEFVRGVKPTLEEIRESGNAISKMSSEDRMLDLANRLRPVARAVFDIFRADTPPELRRAFEAFVSG